MKRLSQHSFYLALFLGTLLTVAGLSLYRELPVWKVLAGVVGLLFTLSVATWGFLSLVNRSEAPPANVPKKSDALL